MTNCTKKIYNLKFKLNASLIFKAMVKKFIALFKFIRPMNNINRSLGIFVLNRCFVCMLIISYLISFNETATKYIMQIQRRLKSHETASTSSTWRNTWTCG